MKGLKAYDPVKQTTRRQALWTGGGDKKWKKQKKNKNKPWDFQIQYDKRIDKSP